MFIFWAPAWIGGGGENRFCLTPAGGPEPPSPSPLGMHPPTPSQIFVSHPWGPPPVCLPPLRAFSQGGEEGKKLLWKGLGGGCPPSPLSSTGTEAAFSPHASSPSPALLPPPPSATPPAHWPRRCLPSRRFDGSHCTGLESGTRRGWPGLTRLMGESSGGPGARGDRRPARAAQRRGHC